MKKYNKLLSVILCVAMLFAMVPAVNEVNATGEFKITAGTVSGTAGSEVTVDITLENPIQPGDNINDKSIILDLR